MKIKEFIEQVLLNDIKKMQDAGLHYMSFLIIAVGIELLGACEDEKDFNKEGLVKQRFKKGLNFFDKKYQDEADQLYTDLRCGFAHNARPTGKLSLTEHKHAGKDGDMHLYKEVKSGNLILVAEDFYNDFKHACNKVIEKIGKGELNNKVNEVFLLVPSDNANYDATSIPASGASNIIDTPTRTTSTPQIYHHK